VPVPARSREVRDPATDLLTADMDNVGCGWIPQSSATLGPYDRIHTRTADVETACRTRAMPWGELRSLAVIQSHNRRPLTWVHRG
jgi:hypothetical protein